MELQAELIIDDSKIKIIRGPEGLRTIALAIVERAMPGLPAQEHDDAQQVINWLKELKV